METFFQIINTLIWIAIIYILFSLMKFSVHGKKRINQMERDIEELKSKIDKNN